MASSKKFRAGADIPMQRMRRTPLPDSPRPKRSRHRRSTRLGMLLYLKAQGRLHPSNIEFLVKLQGKVRIQELERAVEVYRSLSVSKRAAARAERELQHVIMTCTLTDAKSKLLEQRRIGVGYRDKGSLRPSHEDHKAPVRAFWSEDIAQALLSSPDEAQWIAADEFYGPERYEVCQELALFAFIQNCSSYQNLSSKLPYWSGLTSP